jgi:hypothetical protein
MMPLGRMMWGKERISAAASRPTSSPPDVESCNLSGGGYIKDLLVLMHDRGTNGPVTCETTPRSDSQKLDAMKELWWIGIFWEGIL